MASYVTVTIAVPFPTALIFDHADVLVSALSMVMTSADGLPYMSVTV